jgi:kumamolisin
MRSPRSLAAATALAAATITLAAAGPAAHANTAGLPAVKSLRLPDSVAPFAAASNAVGAVPVATKLTIQIWMTPRSAAAVRYAVAVSTPGSLLFRHFLSPAGYTARFGPTQAAVASVESWLRSKGFTGVGTDLGRDYVQATAAVSTIEAALRVRLNYYRTRGLAAAGRYQLRANDRPVSLPASIAPHVPASPAWTTRRRR